MKTKFYLLLIVLIVSRLGSIGQVANINPDTTDIPWIVGDAIPMTTEIGEKVILMSLTSESAATDLPSSFDNSTFKFMPPVRHQGNANSCVHVADTWYTFGYEINRCRDLTAGDYDNDQSNLYSFLYTYNFLNGGSSNNAPTPYASGFETIIDNGCPVYNTYFDSAMISTYDKKYSYWMNGYDNYKSGMQNRVSDIYGINWTNDLDSLSLLKHWIADHNSGDETGGLAIIGALQNILTYGELPSGTPYEGEYFISTWGYGKAHTLTIVGYDDEICCFDFDDNDVYENIDINGDSIIQLDECEKGALKVANSYGNWKNDGYIWVPYKLLAAPGLQLPYDGFRAYTCRIDSIPTPDFTVKINAEHTCRHELSFKVGYAEYANQSQPIDDTSFMSFSEQGGCFDMRGKAYTGPIEFGLDFSYYYGNEDFGKVFLIVTETDEDDPDSGDIQGFSLVDYRWGEIFELNCDSTNVSIIDNDTTTLAIDYDLIPHESNITSNHSFHSNMVSRFMPTVDNNSTLTVENGVRLDMYSSEIYIKNGSTLELQDSAVILAKRGNCKITIDGDIDVGSGVIFEAEDGASLEIKINNNSLSSNFTNVTFRNTKLTNYGQNLTISGSLFENCPLLSSYRGNVTIKDSTVFDESHVYLADQTSGSNNKVIVNSCFFARPYQVNPRNYVSALEVWNYSNFFIENNEIDGYYTGIVISQSGGGLAGNQIIYNNELSNLNTSGIITFSTTATLLSNYIHSNDRGVSFTNNSNISMHGYSYATTYDDINFVTDNSSYEVYASELSFPWYFRYNAIIDNDNLGNDSGDPLVYHDTQGSVMPGIATNNCWGDGFLYSDDLYPTTIPYIPTWCPDDGGEKSSEVALQSYQDGLEYFENEEYEDARDEFESIIELYPET